MALTIVGICIFFIVCTVIAVKAKDRYPKFTNEQLLNQHVRFLEDLESSRKYIGATYLLQKEKGSDAAAELELRGFDVACLMRERALSERANRKMNWNTCRKGKRSLEDAKNV